MQALGLQGEGFYYNELTGNLSSAELTLRGFFVPTVGSTQSAYINIVTHLTNQRVRSLVKAGSSFAEAVAQAEQELLDELAITIADFDPNASGVEMNLAGGDTDANAYLFGVSSTIVQTAQDEQGNSLEAKLQELLNAKPSRADASARSVSAHGVRAKQPAIRRQPGGNRASKQARRLSLHQPSMSAHNGMSEPDRGEPPKLQPPALSSCFIVAMPQSGGGSPGSRWHSS